jgi:hypothetical protein
MLEAAPAGRASLAAAAPAHTTGVEYRNASMRRCRSRSRDTAASLSPVAMAAEAMISGSAARPALAAPRCSAGRTTSRRYAWSKFVE